MDVIDLARQHGQEQVLRYWDELDDRQRQQLRAQLESIDWERIDEWIETYVRRAPEVTVPADMQPPEVFPPAPRDATPAEQYARAEATGMALLRRGQVAAFTVAGGQGTRLGYDGPKGSFPITPVAGKSLFQFFAESLLRWGDIAGHPVPWYIMTSETNDEPTRDFFAAHDHFGMDPANIMFFVQGMMPAFDFDGKLLLAARDSLFMSPDGHGGSLKALRHSGALEDMARRGVLEISYFQVDNPLVSVISPLFLGLHHQRGAQMSCRSLRKRDAFEKLGLFVRTDDRIQVIEYSDLPDEIATRTEADGELAFSAGSPAIHIIKRSFVEQLTDGPFRLPWHRAEKKIPHLDAAGNLVQPEQPNGIKLETFVFDALPLAEQVVLLEAVREEEFAPVKNQEGQDSPASSRRLLQEHWAGWIERRGVDLPRDADGELDLRLEIAPRRCVREEDFQSIDLGLYSFDRGSQISIA